MWFFQSGSNTTYPLVDRSRIIGISLANLLLLLLLQFLGRAEFAGGDQEGGLSPSASVCLSVHPGYRLPILTPAELCFARSLAFASSIYQAAEE